MQSVRKAIEPQMGLGLALLTVLNAGGSFAWPGEGRYLYGRELAWYGKVSPVSVAAESVMLGKLGRPVSCPAPRERAGKRSENNDQKQISRRPGV
ncbi:hypothetical protein EV426DRAFT_625003 [Tirmania nivea]|nr:hypothetical protein EV426DRAFT_625003 [Tirmania nivea]